MKSHSSRIFCCQRKKKEEKKPALVPASPIHGVSEQYYKFYSFYVASIYYTRLVWYSRPASFMEPKWLLWSTFGKNHSRNKMLIWLFASCCVFTKDTWLSNRPLCFIVNVPLENVCSARGNLRHGIKKLSCKKNYMLNSHLIQKSCIWETLNLSTSSDSRTNTKTQLKIK